MVKSRKIKRRSLKLERSYIRPVVKVEEAPLNPPDAGEEILLPLLLGEGWGGVLRIYVRGLLIENQAIALNYIMSVDIPLIKLAKVRSCVVFALIATTNLILRVI